MKTIYINNSYTEVNNSIIKVNSNELAKTLIKRFEGLRLSAYLCPAGKKTIGYGHVLKDHESYLRLITKVQAELLLDQDIMLCRNALNKHCDVPLKLNQEAALLSFIYNCGAEAFARSTLLKKLNEGDYEATANELLRWVNVKGVKVMGLVRRREAERGLFLNSNYFPNRALNSYV